MPSINYNDIYSRFYDKVSAYDFLSLNDEQIESSLCNWLHAAANKIYIRKLFNSFSFDDEIQTIVYEYAHEIDEEFDREFLLDILSSGVLVEWLSPKINHISNIAQMVGSKEEKYYSQSAHLREIKNLHNSTVHSIKQQAADRGYGWNSYLSGE